MGIKWEPIKDPHLIKYSRCHVYLESTQHVINCNRILAIIRLKLIWGHAGDLLINGSQR